MAISRLLVEANQIVVAALCDKANGYEQVTSQRKVFSETETEEQQKLEKKEH